MKNLNLQYLRTFMTVADLGSFSAAAVRQGLTQPAVSLQVRQLERALGVRLMERIGRRPRPTAAGTNLLGYARQIDAVVLAAIESTAHGAAAEPVRLGCGATACTYLLPGILGALHRRLPKLQFIVTTGNTREIAKAVEENLLDIALVTLPSPGGRALEVMPVLQDEFVLVAHPKMTLPGRPTAAKLSGVPMILFEPGGNTRRIVDDWFAAGGAAIRPSMSLGSVEAIKEMAREKLGCTILPRSSLLRAQDRRNLVVKSLSPRLHRELAIVVRRDKPLFSGLRATLDALKNLPHALRH
jgi:DNA-binding transcriptional LysR family regulator